MDGQSPSTSPHIPMQKHADLLCKIDAILLVWRLLSFGDDTVDLGDSVADYIAVIAGHEKDFFSSEIVDMQSGD